MPLIGLHANCRTLSAETISTNQWMLCAAAHFRYLGCKQRIRSAVNDRMASSRILELGCAVVEGLPSGRCPILSRSSALFSSSASYEKGCQRQLSASRGAIFPKTLQGKIETDGYQKMSPLILDVTTNFVRFFTRRERLESLLYVSRLATNGPRPGKRRRDCLE